LLFKESLENIPIGLIIYDYKNNVHFINKTGHEILNIEEGEELSAALIERKFNKQRRPPSKPNAAYDSDLYYRFYKSGGDEIVLYRKELPCSINGEEYVLSAFIDITPIEKERKYEAASNTAKSDFLAKMSHEIRTPMNGIFGMAEALERESVNEIQKEYIQIIRKSADLLLNIIDDILDYSKIEAGKMLIEDVPFRLREEICLSVDIFKAVANEKGLIIEINVAKGVPDKIIGDPFRLRQILSNLISNAIKFTHEGEIRICVSLEEEYSGNLTILFSVADTGVGIPGDKLSTIFDSFTQAEKSTTRKYGGTGLGTTICKQLVTLMNGEIWAESPSGLSANNRYPGTTFNFTLELFSNEEIPKDLDFTDIVSYKDVKVLIVTPNINKKERLYSLLERLKIYPETFYFKSNYQELETVLFQKKHHLVIIIDDETLDAIKLAELFYKNGRTNNHRFFILGAEHKPEYFIKSKLAGIDYYIYEPFEHKTLLSYLKECFANVHRKELEGLELNKNLSILVAEDNIINQKVAQTIFQSLGQEINLVSDGAEAIKKVKNSSFDIVFMDLEMPEVDGFEAVIEIRSLGYYMPIIAMTASVSESNKNHALKVGMNDYIIKPVKKETIQAILEKWFA
jgi:signal transduction histidine kinase/CheY-like chemotaxis protein